MEKTQPVQTGLFKTYLIGTATPFLSIYFTIARKERPRWFARELLYTDRPLRNICFAFGLMSGMTTGATGIYHTEKWLIDQFLASTAKHDIQPVEKSPKELRQLPESENGVNHRARILV